MSWSSAPSNSSSGRRHAARDDRLDVDLVTRLATDLARIEEPRALRDRFEQVPVDGEPVVRVPLRARAHVRPLGEQSREDTFVVERLEDGDGVRTGTQEPDEAGPLPHVPGRLTRRLQTRQRRAVERHHQLGRCAGRLERPQRRHRTVGVDVDVDAAVSQPDTFGQRAIGLCVLRTGAVDLVADP